VDATTITASASASSAPTYIFEFSNIDNYGNAQAFWDMYRIDAIRFSVIPINNAVQVTTPASNTFVPLYCVIDYDNATALTSAAVAKGYDNCIEIQPGESLERTFQPHIAVGAYSGGGFGAYANLAPTWIDCVNPSVQHYGVKIFVPAATASQTLLQQWAVEVEYWVSLRAVDN